VIRAVNQCGVGKDYAATTVGSGGGNTAPQVAISAPADGATFTAGTTISFAGSATDSEDGNLSASLSWSSSRDGTIGSGGSFTSTLSVGSHTITAAVTDSGGLPGSAAITVTVTDDSCGGLSEDFEGGTTGWTLGGLWHEVSDSGCAVPGYASAVTAVYYGRDSSCNYNTGSRTTGDLISPEISGLTADSTLTFAYFREVEDEPSFEIDTTEVAVQVTGTTTWTTIWYRDSTDFSGSTWTSSGALSLAAYAGQTIRIRFRFDSVDEIANRHTGWLVDDVVVTGSSGCGSDTIFGDGFEVGDTGAWSLTVQ
jgi:hypothetical protein